MFTISYLAFFSAQILTRFLSSVVRSNTFGVTFVTNFADDDVKPVTNERSTKRSTAGKENDRNGKRKRPNSGKTASKKDSKATKNGKQRTGSAGSSAGAKEARSGSRVRPKSLKMDSQPAKLPEPGQHNASCYYVTCELWLTNELS